MITSKREYSNDLNVMLVPSGKKRKEIKRKLCISLTRHEAAVRNGVGVEPFGGCLYFGHRPREIERNLLWTKLEKIAHFKKT